MKVTKRVLSIILVIVTLVSVVSISAEALSVELKDKNFGYMVPVNNKGTDVISTAKLYGNYDYLNFYINAKRSSETYFFYEIFSDKKLTKCVGSDFVLVDDKGTFNVSFKINLKDKYKSKTYYVVTYAATYYEYDDLMVVDQNSMCQFKMVVDKSPSYKEKKVALKTVSNTVDGPEITWTKISGTSKYYIYRRSITGTKWTKVGSVSGKNSSFVDTSVKKKDGNYIYTVKGIAKNGDVSRYHYSGLTCLYAEAPVLNTIKVLADNVVYLKWNETSSKAKYNVYRKEVGGDWKRIATKISSNSYRDATAKSCVDYQYTVKAIITSGYGTATSSCYQNTSKKIKYLPAPATNDLYTTEDGIGVSWELVEGATSYSIMRKPLDSDDPWTVLEEVSAETTTYIDTTASLIDGAYLYTVRSEADGFVGSYATGKTYIVLAQPEFRVIGRENGMRLEWEKVPYATSYRVLEQNEEGNWILKGKTKNNYYDLYPSTYYNKKLTVYACRTGDIFSTYKTDVEPTIYFPRIPFEIKEYEAYTKFDWNGTGADAYRLYRKPKDAPDTDYELLYENSTRGFNDYNPQDDVAYTYQIRAVYGDIEQNNNIVTKTHTRYSPERCIDSFKVIKKTMVFNNRYKSSDRVTESYQFDVDKTDTYKKSAANIYYLSNYDADDGWRCLGQVSEVDVEDSIYSAVAPLRFSCVVSTNSGNTTPIGANPVYVNEESCGAPEVTLTPTSKGLKMTWDAVDGAVEYDVAVYFSKRADYKKSFKADGSKTYTINFDDVSYDYSIYLTITAIHENGNKTTRYIDDYEFYAKPKLVAAVPDNFSDGIDFFWNCGFDDGYFAVLRKAEGESKWTCVSKKYYDGKVYSMNNGVEYRGFVYTDKNVKKGVKYTYTVRWYDPKTKEYTSYYNTKGVSSKP